MIEDSLALLSRPVTENHADDELNVSFSIALAYS